jgi:hypothetical protein
MDEMWTRVGEQLMARVSGPMHFRLYLQPGMALILAVIDGVKDAKAGKPPYFSALITDPTHDKERLKDGARSISRVFILALILDAIYQAIELHFFYVGEALIVAIILAILPYIVFRGIVRRLARKRFGPANASNVAPPDSARR